MSGLEAPQQLGGVRSADSDRVRTAPREYQAGQYAAEPAVVPFSETCGPKAS